MLRSLSVRWLVPVAVLVLVLPGCGDSSSDIDTVEQLVDAHDLAWVNNDPEGVGALYTDEGVFVDLVGSESVGREDVVEYARVHVELITESRRTGPVEVHEDGTFLFPAHLVVTDRGSYTGVVAVTIEDGLFARYDWFERPNRQ